MECIFMVLGLMCFDGSEHPGRQDKSDCKAPLELGFVGCENHNKCNVHYGMVYMSASYIKKNKIKWCQELK